MCKDETKKSSRMHGAWCVGLIAGDNYVAVGSQRVAQGEIDNFDACVRLVVGDAILGVLNKGVIFAANRRIEQTSLELLHLLMQHSPCSDKVMQGLLRPSFALATCEHQNQPCLAGP